MSTIPLRALGRSGVRVPALGVGTNQWGARGKGAEALSPVFEAALDAGANLFDTAEIYQLGRSEKALGECMRKDGRPVFIVDKFAPYPTRFSAKSLLKALDASLARLGTQAVDLYLIHFPFTFLRITSLMDALAEAVRNGKVRAVGVSNFSAKQMYTAAERLERHGVPLAANEVHYSLLHRNPERNGVLEACRKLDVALIAYRPLAGGRIREGARATDEAVARVAHARHKSVAQVALNWLLQQDERIIAIPGATGVAHLRENVEAALFTLSDEDLAALARASA
jgi:aryl-alcohol dehydrogenase-like predicted oxidoreductase